MSSRLYAFARFLGRTLFRALFPYRVTGEENLPAEGGCMVCSNHTCALDPIVVGATLKRPVRFMGKEELFRGRAVGALLKKLGAFPVSRGGNDIAAVRTALGVLRDGEVLGIFPEGTRAREGQVLPWLTGAALIALRADVPVVPAHISRAPKLFRVTEIAYGEPIRFAKEERRFDSASLEKATEKMRAASLALGKKA